MPCVGWLAVTVARQQCPGRRFSNAARASSWWPRARSAPGRAHEPLPERLHPQLRAALERDGIDGLYAHQADALESAYQQDTIVTTGTASGKSLAFNLPGARHAGARPLRARPLPLPDEGAGPGPGARAAQAGPALPAPGDLRRRHPARGAARDPRPLQPDPHQPRHAARGRAPQSPGVGRPAGQPRLDRGGRGPRLPRRVRLARGERAAPTGPPGAGLRHRAALRAGQRDDRQPGGAGGGAHRTRRGAGGARRRAAGRAPDRDVEPAAGGRAHRGARLAAGRGGRPAGRPRGAGSAHDLLPEVAPRGRADPALHPPAPGGSRPRRPGRAGGPLPRRLHAVPAARDRAEADGRRAAGRGGHRALWSWASTWAISTPRSA